MSRALRRATFSDHAAGPTVESWGPFGTTSLHRILLTVAVALACLLAGPAWAQRRVALIIGNSAYGSENKLENPVNDARLMAATLRSLGFSVELRTDLAKREMELAITRFTRETVGADSAVLYFAGHGAQLVGGGRNFLLPVDARIADDDTLQTDGIPADRIVELLERNPNPARLRLVILDACRNNSLAGMARSGIRGLARMTPSSDYTLIAFSTNDQDVALDGRGEHSPYTQSLAKYLARAGELPLRRIFELTASEVRQVTGNQQRPRTYGDLDSRAMLDGRVAEASVPTPPQATVAPLTDKLPPTDDQVEMQAWTEVKAANLPAAFRAYLAEYPNGRFARLARIELAKIDALQEQQQASRGGGDTSQATARPGPTAAPTVPPREPAAPTVPPRESAAGVGQPGAARPSGPVRPEGSVAPSKPASVTAGPPTSSTAGPAAAAGPGRPLNTASSSPAAPQPQGAATQPKTAPEPVLALSAPAAAVADRPGTARRLPEPGTVLRYRITDRSYGRSRDLQRQVTSIDNNRVVYGHGLRVEDAEGRLLATTASGGSDFEVIEPPLGWASVGLAAGGTQAAAWTARDGLQLSMGVPRQGKATIDVGGAPREVDVVDWEGRGQWPGDLAPGFNYVVTVKIMRDPTSRHIVKLSSEIIAGRSGLTGARASNEETLLLNPP